MYCDVKIGQMGIAPFVEEDIVWLEVSLKLYIRAHTMTRTTNTPMYYVIIV
jgi:hypothetical protein